MRRSPGRADAYEAITRRAGASRSGYEAMVGATRRSWRCRTFHTSACVLPTGGGKTILGAHAVGIARDEWIEKDYPLVLWLTPTKTIRRQTAEALKNTRHAYRRALDESFGGRVRELLILRTSRTCVPHDVRDKCCVVVGTIQTLRVTKHGRPQGLRA